MLEILAPAGNVACADVAIKSGADAVYLGYRAFSARQGAENFDMDTLRDFLARAHLLGARVYLAMNTMVKDAETEEFLSALRSVWEAGVDAIILQDALLGKCIKEKYPQIVLHLSTQAGVCNENGAKFAKECGFSRVILARETPLEEIKKITKIIETEAFVQGALCTSFSGQCYFSSFAGGNSGNRGRCKQPCRKRYSYNRLGKEEQCYALSLSDLSVGEDIEKYISAGVTSFKIEGRMRREEYVSASVQYYRCILDGIGDKNKALSDLKRTYNRGNYTKGLAFGQDKKLLSVNVQGHIGEKVGNVIVKNTQYFVESRFSPSKGDAFKILRDGKEVGGAFFVKKENRGFIVSSKTRLKNGDGVFITTDTELNSRLLNVEKRKKVSLCLSFKEGAKACVIGEGVCVYSEDVLQTASSAPLTKEDIIACFTKTDSPLLDVVFEKIEIIGNVFIPKSKLNAFRRDFYAKLFEKYNGKREPLTSYTFTSPNFVGENNKTAVLASDFSGVIADIAVYKPNNYAENPPASFINGAFEKYMYYPAFATANDEAKIAEACEKYALDGVYVENYGGINFAEKYILNIFAGTGLNLLNRLALSKLLEKNAGSYYVDSKEGTDRENIPLISSKAFVLSTGDIKLMDLCYCPFGKTCGKCDKKDVYTLTDENGRVFPVRRFMGADGDCRFEVYNCAKLVHVNTTGAGTLCDLTVEENKIDVLSAKNNAEMQKNIFTKYTSGHFTKGVL